MRLAAGNPCHCCSITHPTPPWPSRLRPSARLAREGVLIDKARLTVPWTTVGFIIHPVAELTGPLLRLLAAELGDRATTTVDRVSGRGVGAVIGVVVLAVTILVREALARST